MITLFIFSIFCLFLGVCDESQEQEKIDVIWSEVEIDDPTENYSLSRTLLEPTIDYDFKIKVEELKLEQLKKELAELKYEYARLRGIA